MTMADHPATIINTVPKIIILGQLTELKVISVQVEMGL